ncbi:TetR family transcriptional regulator [Streptomyces sp. NPDC093510]|uniref:TetR/AcrR family transcriptional regulator n=1 Tax=Streptomyces sp. NPDC093510 TaxID=3155199 RepID=UPI003444E552
MKTTQRATDLPETRPGLRERKKQRTRDALLRVALELFTTKGYEETTVDEIAEAVDVSQRTFFRYFANKQEAVFAVQEMVEERFVRALRDRPAHEAPLVALRSTVLGTWEAMGQTIEEVVPVELHMRTYQMIESTPALLAVHLRRSVEMEDEIARLIAEREGLDLDSDPRPRVAVAAFSGVMRATGRLWGAGEDTSPESIRDLTATYLDHLGPALAEEWRTP